MVQRDRSSRLKRVHAKVVLMVVMWLAGQLAGCAPSPPDPSMIKLFIQAVTQHIETNSEFGFSEAEIYLTVLSHIPDAAIYEFGDRTCETLRRGGSSKQIADTIQARFPRDEERMVYMHIAQAAEKTLCPESSFPVEGWQRSLFFWRERLNGGMPI